jgi:hypothetical protein
MAGGQPPLPQHEGAMSAQDAVERFLASGKRASTATRMVGYAVLIQRGGWELIHRLMDPGSAAMLREGFAEAGVDPASIAFPEGPRNYLEELLRSSLHPAAAELASQLLAEAD